MNIPEPNSSKARNAVLAFVLPLALLLGLVLWRKSSSGKASRWAEGVLRVDGQSLRRSQELWNGVSFLAITNDEAAKYLNELISKLSVPESAKLGASRSCLGMLKAFGTGDWTVFRSVRIPIPGYAATSAAKKHLLKNSSAANMTNVLNAYQAVWQMSFKEKPLFTEISLASNSVTGLIRLQSIPLK